MLPIEILMTDEDSDRYVGLEPDHILLTWCTVLHLGFERSGGTPANHRLSYTD